MPPLTGVKIEIGGKQRTLRYTWRSLRKLEDERNGEALSTTVVRAGTLSAQAITALLWAGFLHDSPDLTVEQVASMIEPPLRPLIDAVVKALEPWMENVAGESEPGKVEEPTPTLKAG